MRRRFRAFLKALYEEKYGLMFFIARNILKNDADAEDAVHEAVVRLIPRAGQLIEMNAGALNHYVASTVQHCAVDMKRRKEREIPMHLPSEPEARSETENESVELLALNEMTAEQVRLALGQLPQMYRQVLEWKYLDGMSDEAIAAEMGISPNSVRTYLTRARRQLRQILEEQHER